jgi:calpain-15
MSHCEALWPKLKQYDEEGALISASTSGVDEETKKEGRGRGGGLVPGHAYTVIALKEAYGNRLVNIRNPWG